MTRGLKFTVLIIVTLSLLTSQTYVCAADDMVDNTVKITINSTKDSLTNNDYKDATVALKPTYSKNEYKLWRSDRTSENNYKIHGIIVPKMPKLFSDTNIEDWYYEDLFYAVNKYKYISGYPDGTFKPNSYISSGEFCKMLCEAFDIKVTETDMSSVHWAYDYAVKIRNLGNDELARSTAGLERPIKRKIAIKGLLGIMGINFPTDSKWFNHSFEDIKNIGTRNDYNDYLINAYELGIIRGNNNNKLYPDEYLTRAEWVYILNHAIKMRNANAPDPDLYKKYSEMFIFKDEVAESYKNDVYTFINNQPKDLLDAFLAAGGTIEISKQTAEDHFKTDTPESIKGCYYSDSDKIFIFTYGKYSSLIFSITSTLTHEFGHYIYSNWLSDEAKYNLLDLRLNPDVCNSIAKYTGRDYYKTNPNEFFAELYVSIINRYSWTNIRYDVDFCGTEKILSDISDDFIIKMENYKKDVDEESIIIIH